MKFIKTHTRSKNTTCKVNNSFMFKFVLLKPSLHQLIVMMKSTIIHFKQYLIAAQFLELFLIKTFYIVTSLISITIFIMFTKILFNYQGERTHF